MAKHMHVFIFFILATIFVSNMALAQCPLHSEKSWGIANNSSYINYGYGDPLPGFATVSQGYGIGSTSYPNHLGVDWLVSAGTNVYSICDGFITTDSQDFTYQKNVRERNNYEAYWNSRIIVSCKNPLGAFLAIYGHVDGQAKLSGQPVKKGEKIGTIATAYDSNNQRSQNLDHLHFGIRSGHSTPFWDGRFGIAPHPVTLATAESNGYYDPLEYLCENPSAPTDKFLTYISPDTTSVYWVQNNKKYHVLSATVLNDMQGAGIPGWSWLSIYTVSNTYSSGPEFISTSSTSNGLYIRLVGGSDVYMVNNGKKKYVSYAACKNVNCWPEVIDVPQTYLDMFPDDVTPRPPVLLRIR